MESYHQLQNLTGQLCQQNNQNLYYSTILTTLTPLYKGVWWFFPDVGSLALNDAVHLALLAQVCTAMGTEALLGTQGSHAPFLHAVARPHSGQVSISISHQIFIFL